MFHLFTFSLPKENALENGSMTPFPMIAGAGAWPLEKRITKPFFSPHLRATKKGFVKPL
jgi:hypothetical protein